METLGQALQHWRLRHSIAANNVANAGTPGFKAEQLFSRLLEDGGMRSVQATDHSAGDLRRTGSELDVALGDRGFMVVRTEGGERLIRGGSFRLDETGRLVDDHGNPVLGEAGEIVLPPGQVEIDRRGDVHVDGQPVGRLRIVDVRDPGSLERERGVRFRHEDMEALQRLEASERDVRQGFLEESNVGSIEGMVELVEIQRNYGAVQRSMRTMDGVLETIARDLARPI